MATAITINSKIFGDNLSIWATSKHGDGSTVFSHVGIASKNQTEKIVAGLKDGTLTTIQDLKALVMPRGKDLTYYPPFS